MPDGKGGTVGKTTLAVLPRHPGPSRWRFEARRWRRGILLGPVWVDGRLLGEPGQAVRYREEGERLDVVVGVYRLVRDVPRGQVVFYHRELTPSRVYLQLTRSRPENETRPGDQCLLAANVAREFQAHELHEELMILACRYAEAYEENGETRFPWTRMLIKETLRAHPRGRHRDWMEWKSVQLKYRCRDDGDVAGPLSAVQACERFLAVRPRSAYRAEIKLHMARLYHAAYECIMLADRQEHRRGLTRVHAERLKKRSEHLYRSLVDSPDLQTRHQARVALHDSGRLTLPASGRGRGGEVKRSRW
jgi:hypothetical protein